jgi:hypothetical protein
MALVKDEAHLPQGMYLDLAHVVHLAEVANVKNRPVHAGFECGSVAKAPEHTELRETRV